MEVSTFDFKVVKWRIDQFSSAASRDDPNTSLNSPEFKLSSGASFCLQLEPTTRQPNGNKGYCALFLKANNLAGNKSVVLTYRPWIENTSGDKLGPRLNIIKHEFVGNQNWGYPEFVQHNLLYGSEFIKEDVVIIRCEIQVIKPTNEEIPLDNSQRQAIEAGKKEWDFYEQGFTGACVIQVADQEFKVGKNKLMASSRVFEKMFLSGMQESQTGTVSMKDTSPAVIQALIKYLHVRDLENPGEIALELYILADKYEIDDLKMKCSRILVDGLDKGNFLDRVTLAFNRNDGEFKNGIFNYLMGRPGIFKDIMKSEEWKKFATENAQQSNEIIDEVFQNMKWC